VFAFLRVLLDTFHALTGTASSALGSAARSLAELTAAMLASDAGAFTLVAATATFAVLALLAVAVALVRSPARAVDPTAVHPRRGIHDATRLTETHPDAPGHTRPRAPGIAALAA
jgi:hypothetical protein